MAISEEEFHQLQANIARNRTDERDPKPDIKKPLKYRNKPVRSDDGFFHSSSEKDRWEDLKNLQDHQEICFLDRQVKVEVCTGAFWEAEGKFLQPISWIIDFQYYHVGWGVWVVEDWKSEITRQKSDYILKRQLFLQRFPSIRYIETGKHKK